MRKLYLSIVMSAALVVSTSAAAQTKALLSDAVDKVSPGAVLWLSSYNDLKNSLPAAHAFTNRKQAPVLQLTDVSYANLAWKNIALVFDRDRTLSRIQLTTNKESYDSIKQRLVKGADPIWSISGSSGLLEDASDDAVMICEHDDGSVTLTFNRVQPAAPVTLLARADLPSASLITLGE